VQTKNKRHTAALRNKQKRKEANMIRKYRTLLWLVLMIPFLLLVTKPSAEEQTPSGTVSIKATSVAAGVGVKWGEGALTINGKTYPFSLQGLEIAGVGVTNVDAEGKVYNLNKVSDFEGVYVAAEAGIAAGGGPAAIAMRNPKGVTLSLQAAQQGVKLTLAAQGVEIKLQEKQPAS
jgi:hypothetical protein